MKKMNTLQLTSESKCPCGKNDTYGNCCQRFHKGASPKSAVELMRSRYSAYVLNIPEYIIQTTHPASPQYIQDHALWKEKIYQFSRHSIFQGLDILDSQEKDSLAIVTFVAHLLQENQDASFTERSYFEKRNGFWLYRSGQLTEGHSPNLITIGQMRLLPLAYFGDEILRQKASPITEISDDLYQLIDEMIETMDACGGIGLAAPQVHHCIQLFVIRTPMENDKGGFDCGDHQVFINPTLSCPSQETWIAPEGCLSIPTIRAHIKRPKEITVEYTNEHGKRLQKRVFGWEARVIMHEYDHLQGSYFIDHMDTPERKTLDPFLHNLTCRLRDPLAL